MADYLTERSLSTALQQLVGDRWKGTQVGVPGSRRRWDMAFASPTGETVVVEYDGDEHYCNSLKIKTDREKDAAARQTGYRTVRFPYWLQLDHRTLRQYFDIDAAWPLSFPHGFITTKWFPASFCDLGFQRFRRELDWLDATVRREVVQSLRDRIAEHGEEFVVPQGWQW